MNPSEKLNAFGATGAELRSTNYSQLDQPIRVIRNLLFCQLKSYLNIAKSNILYFEKPH